jgi:hypothetical protein
MMSVSSVENVAEAVGCDLTVRVIAPLCLKHTTWRDTVRIPTYRVPGVVVGQKSIKQKRT